MLASGERLRFHWHENGIQWCSYQVKNVTYTHLLNFGFQFCSVKTQMGRNLAITWAVQESLFAENLCPNDKGHLIWDPCAWILFPWIQSHISFITEDSWEGWGKGKGCEGWDSHLWAFRRSPFGVILLGSFGISSLCFLRAHMMLSHCFLPGGKNPGSWSWLSFTSNWTVCLYFYINNPQWNASSEGAEIY